ncbi:MAG: ABC transporter permease [Acidobacteria bacterium]|nr:ABC transporter permease [Acidobacteriota bacterium]
MSLRQIRRQPGLAAAVVLTLGLAIGATTAIFSFVNALLIRPFPFRDPDQLVEIRSVRGGEQGKLSMLEILDIREQVEALDGIAAHTGGAGGYNYSGEGRPEEWRAVLTTGNLFEVLGSPLVIGSPWPQAIDRDRDYRVILTHEVWQSAFGGARDIVGKKITLDHAAGYEIHGVAPAGFDFPQGIQVYRSIGGYTSYDKRDSRNVVGIARIQRPHSLAQLQAELDAVSQRLAEQYPDTNAGLSFQAIPFRELYTGNARPYLLVLLGAVGFVLLIACANVVNLMLSRALGREREMAVRLAMGARRSSIFAQLLTESTVLSLSAAGVGLALAYWWMKLLRTMIGFGLPRWMVVELDGRVLAFTAILGALCGIASGFAPALHLAVRSVGESLKEGSRGSSGGKSVGRLRDLMIVGEVALAVVLLTGAGLLVRGFHEMLLQEKGFRTDRISTFRVALGWKRYGGDAIARYYERAQEKLSAIPGVEAVAFAPNPPLAQQEESSPRTVRIEGQSALEAMRNPYVNFQQISENYFEALEIPLKSGRFFNKFDGKDSEPVVIVSARLAALLWPGKDPIGQRLLYDPRAREPGPWRTVVGVAGNVQQGRLGAEPGLDVFCPYRQCLAANQYLLVRHRLGERELQSKAEEAMWSIDPEQSVFDFATYDQRILGGIWQLRISRSLLILFGLVGLVLAAMGIYGVMSYLVGQQEREMGIRLALGASPGSVRLLVIKRAAWVSALGLGIGLAGAAGLGRVIERALPGVSGSDLPSFAGALLALGAVTLFAASVPAWRASRIDPGMTLRAE